MFPDMISAPVQKQRIVRTIIACASPTFNVERRVLAENVYPKLRQYCMASYGMEFQIFDFDSTSPGVISTDAHYMQQLKICQEQSIGPSVIALLGEESECRPWSLTSTDLMGFTDVLEQAYFDYPEHLRNRECLFILRRRANPSDMHQKRNKYQQKDENAENERTLKEEIHLAGSEKNILNFGIHSTDSELVSNDDHHYLENLCEAVYHKMTKLIDENVAEYTNSTSSPEASCRPEMTQHWNYTERIRTTFSRESVSDYIVKYLEGDSYQMLMVHGDCVQDLSSTMASVAWSTRLWGQNNHGHSPTKTTVIIRYCGFTPESGSTYHLLRSLCQQIRGTSENIPKTKSGLLEYFHRIVHDGEHAGNLVLFLDSVHLLSDVSWLPNRLAANTKIVVSMTSDSDAMATIKRKCYDYQQYLKVPELNLIDQVDSLNNLYLNRYKQKLSKQQLNELADILKKCDGSNHYTEMVVKFAEKQSLSLFKAFATMPTVNACLENQLCCVSINYPRGLFEKSMAYFAAAPIGLSHLELEDLLSLDDDVMKENEATSTNRIPSRIVSSIMMELQSLLMSVQIYGVEVYQWYEASIKQYVSDEYLNSKGLNYTLQIHSNMADYYLGTWHKRPKNFHDSLECRQVSVPAQDLVFNIDTKFPVYNKRKLTLLPYHLAASDRTAELKCLMLYNYDWIATKIQAMSVQDLLYDYILTDCTEAEIIAGSLEDAEEILMNEEEDILSLELSGRLLTYYNEFIEIQFLVDQCDKKGVKALTLVPKLQLYPASKTMLKSRGTLSYHHKYTHQLFENGGIFALFVRQSTGHAVVYDMEKNQTICHIRIPDAFQSYISKCGKYVISFTKEQKILMHSTETGDLCMELSYQGDLIHQISLTQNYLAFTMEKSAGAYIVDLCANTLVHKLNLQTKVVALSPCEEFLVCDGSTSLSMYSLPLVERLCTIDSIPDVLSIYFISGGPEFYLITKSGELLYISIELVCYRAKRKTILRDVEMKEMIISPDKNRYLVHCTRNLYVYNRCNERLFQVKNLLPVLGCPTFQNVSFTSDSQNLVTVQQSYVCVWNSQGDLVRMHENPSFASIHKSIVVGDIFVTTDSDCNVCHWDLARLRNGEAIISNVHASKIDNIVIIDDSRLICFGGAKPELTIVDTNTGRKIRSVIPRYDSACKIRRVSPSQNGEFIITEQVNAEPIFKTGDAIVDANLWRTEDGECMLTCVGIEHCGFSPGNDVAFFVNRNSMFGRECLVFQLRHPGTSILTLPPLPILANPVIDSAANLRFFTSDLEQFDLLLWKIPLTGASEYKSVYFSETYGVTAVKATSENPDIVHILHIGGLITYDLSLHQIMKIMKFPSSEKTIYSKNFSKAIDGRRLHDLYHSTNEKLLRMRSAPDLVRFIDNDQYLAYISEEMDKLIVKRVSDGRRQAWCPLHGKGTAIAVASDDKTVLVGCEDGRILALTLVADKNSKSLISKLLSRQKRLPHTAKRILEKDLERIVLGHSSQQVVTRISSSSRSSSASNSRPNSSSCRPFAARASSTMTVTHKFSETKLQNLRPYTR